MIGREPRCIQATDTVRFRVTAILFIYFIYFSDLFDEKGQCGLEPADPTPFGVATPGFRTAVLRNTKVPFERF